MADQTAATTGQILHGVDHPVKVMLLSAGKADFRSKMYRTLRFPKATATSCYSQSPRPLLVEAVLINFSISGRKKDQQKPVSLEVPSGGLEPPTYALGGRRQGVQYVFFCAIRCIQS